MNDIKLPKGWEWKELSEVAIITMGQSPPSNTYTYNKEDMPFFQGKAEFGRRHPSVVKYCSAPKKTAKKNDILMSVRAPVGSINIADVDCCIGRGLCSLRSKNIDLFYLYHILKSKEKEIEQTGQGSTFKAINQKELRKIKIPTPSLPVQKQIVSILERAEKLKEKRQKANEETDKITQSIFYEMFGDPVKNDKGFDTKLLNEVCDKITDGTHITPTYVENGIPFLRVTDLTNSNESKRFISEEEHKQLTKRCRPVKGDILYSKNGTIGVARMVDWDYEFSIFVSLCLLKPNKKVMRSRYLEAFLNTPFALEQAKLHSKKGTITNLHLIEIKQIKIPLPSLESQDEFIERLDALNLVKEKQRSSTTYINMLFDALIQKAFSGKLVS